MSLHESGPAKPGPRRRAAVSLSPETLVRLEPLRQGEPTPLLVRPAVEGVNLLSWAGDHRELLRRKLLHHAALLFRGFTLGDVGEFERIIEVIGGGGLLEYSYASTPRSHVAGNIYTSTEYPANQEIPLHNEMAYTRQWPMKLGFYSVTAATEGGETPLADSRRVYERIPAAIREPFERKKVMYVRNYGEGLDLPWQEVFQTTDRAAVERFCREQDIEFTWKGDDGLRTRQVCQAVARHPVTGETVWFNQAHLFHISNLAKDMRETLLRSFGEDGLPRNTYYGDGSPMDSETLDVVRRVYREESIVFPWQDGDITVLENMLVAHGRRPFTGPRKLVVGMAEPFDGSEA
ncbi:TauD/TfdA family dioxygenase [Amycolatopsis rhizosphaerae]|uniref:TauD/TfdA family dioxygenase n=1 Tax=Amycolatopsis rhizosphaerae TaxID=2053003 RepID=A0A558CYQ0_9PSEU|nr:TauD/TfdA family dioxygenase [Amycolatopsis rhizosphaerae]TVT53850.1 TauD/TfdA family dioxygenase [Amycolatopsis rhizosphaerae]